MGIPEMVLLCLETFQAGYDFDSRLVAIDWEAWDEERTTEIRCVFQSHSAGIVCCHVYSTISRTHGANLNTGQTWELPT